MPARLVWLTIIGWTLASTAIWAADKSALQLGDAKNCVGRKIPAFAARDFRGKDVALADLAGKQFVVVAFLGTECPLAKLYAPRLAELAAQYEAQGVAFLGVDSNRQDSITEIANYARVHGVGFPVLKDVGNEIADLFGAERTPSVFVLDADRVVRYQGRIDDQYGLGNSSGYAQLKVRKRHLVAALDELLAGKPVSEAVTEAPGCLIGRTRQPKRDADVTYSNQIARILQKNCVECHRPGQIAPFALTDYDEVAGWADMIEEVVREQRMPPWHADPKYGHFANDRSLSARDKELIYAWVKSGAPEGNKADLPPPVDYPQGWQLGTPDQIVYMDDKPYAIPAEGKVLYQYFIVDPGWKEDRWIRASECMIGNRAVVHHIFAFAVPSTHALAKQSGHLGDGFEPDLGTGEIKLLAGAAPGTPPAAGHPHMATFVKAGTKLLFQMHYTPNGSPQEDRTSVGFWFAKPEWVRHHVNIGMAINPTFTIPPETDDYPVESAHRFTKDALVLNLTPHMHLRGKAFRYELAYPDGTRETILNVPRYDFNWQVTYDLDEPKFVPAGAVMECFALFDNSTNNLANPDPKSVVRWGDQTWEEMMIGWFSQTTDVDPDKVRGPSRAERFAQAAAAKPPKIGSILSRAAKGALASDASMEKLFDRVAREVPQVDRVCVSVVDDGQVKFPRVAQLGVFDAPLGRTDRTYAAQSSALAALGKAGKTSVEADLSASDAQGDDLHAMRELLGSAVHIPIQWDGKPATLNFWSKEKNAFPPAAVAFLEEVARLVAQPGDERAAANDK